MLRDELLQPGGVQNGDTRHLAAHQGGRDVEGGLQEEPRVSKMEVLDQGPAQVAYAHHNDPVLLVHAQDMADLRAQLVHVIAVALLSELAEAAEVLADLGGGDAHFLSQRTGGDTHAALQVQIIQIAVIPGQTPDDGVRHILLFHISTFTLRYVKFLYILLH